jgi:hypothetical protein
MGNVQNEMHTSPDGRPAKQTKMFAILSISVYTSSIPTTEGDEF